MRPRVLSSGTRSRSTLTLLVGAVVAGGVVVACTGGSGAFSDGMSMYDQAPSSTEQAANGGENASVLTERTSTSEDPTGTSAEPSAGAQGAGGPGSTTAFDCAGTYACVEDGDDDADTLVLTLVNGVCGIAVGNSSYLLSPDGSFLVNGQKVGTWQATSNGFVATSEEGSVTCTRRTSGNASSSSSSTSSSSGGDKGSSGTTIDAGAIPSFDGGS